MPGCIQDEGLRTGRFLKRPAATADPKLLAVQARAQVEAALAAHHPMSALTALGMQPLPMIWRRVSATC